MKLSELKAKLPELQCELEEYLGEKQIPYQIHLFHESTIEDSDAEKAIQIYNAEAEQRQLQQEENTKKDVQWQLCLLPPASISTDIGL